MITQEIMRDEAISARIAAVCGAENVEREMQRNHDRNRQHARQVMSVWMSVADQLKEFHNVN